MGRRDWVRDTPSTPQAALDKALEHITTAKSYQAEIGGSWQTPDGQEINIARRAIIEFAEDHGLSENVAGLIAELQAEDISNPD